MQPKNTVKTLNRHGLIAGATGTGKTKPFKYFLNNYLFGIPVLMMDIKGDFSGIAKEGEEKVLSRSACQNKHTLSNR
jgi:DNA helicase HerA-like ATPase